VLGIVIQHHFNYTDSHIQKVTKMPRSKSSSPAQFEKVLQILMANSASEGIAGRVVSSAEIQEVLQNEIQLSRMSVYMYEIKKAGIALKSIRDGKKVIAYQIPNVMQAKNYMGTRGLLLGNEVFQKEEPAALPEKKKSKKVAKKVEIVEEEDYTPPQWIDNETGEVIVVDEIEC
jgi:hypothetical protein